MGIEEADKLCNELEKYLTEQLKNCSVLLYEIGIGYYSLIIESDLTNSKYINNINIETIENINTNIDAKQQFIKKIITVLGTGTYRRL